MGIIHLIFMNLLKCSSPIQINQHILTYRSEKLNSLIWCSELTIHILSSFEQSSSLTCLFHICVVIKLITFACFYNKSN